MGRYEEVLKTVEELDTTGWDRGFKETLLLYRAEALWHLENIEKSAVLYRSLIDSADDVSLVAHQRLFLAASREEEVAEMQEIISSAERRFSKTILKDFWLGVGVGSFKIQKRDLAEHFLGLVWDLRTEQGADPVVPLILSSIYWDAGEKQRAISLLEEYQELTDSIDATDKRLADYYRLQAEHVQARRLYSAYVGLGTEAPRWEEAAYHLASVELALGNEAAALDQINEALEETGSGEYHQELLRLKVEVLKRTDEIDAAQSALNEYLETYPKDVRRRLDSLNLLFLQQDFSSLKTQAALFSADFPNLREEDPFAYWISQYLTGLSYVSEKSYEEAAPVFQNINGFATEAEGLDEILPYSLYYEGWSFYKMGLLEKAASLFETHLARYPDHDLLARILYLAGLSNYNQRNYRNALVYFSRLASLDSGELREKARFLAAKSHGNLGEREDAAGIFQEIFEKTPGSAFADDALYEHAAIRAAEGRTDEAAEGYHALVKRYPGSALAEEALYGRGEIYLGAGKNREARDAFYEYRLKFPQGSLVDASLYWGGLASSRSGERFGAALYWERIIDEYRDSSFRADAYAKTAEIYAESGDFQKALSLLKQLSDGYPEKAETLNTSRRILEIRHLVQGKSEKEAELSALIEKEGRVSTPSGRQAMVEYARLILFESEPRLELAYELLSEVIATDDRERAAEAQFLLGEYYYRKGDLNQAAEEFLSAAVVNPSDRDLTAASLFRSAEMMGLAGRRQDVEALVERLEKNFPDSQWVTEGKKLLKEAE
jgi:TolA-binding protein